MFTVISFDIVDDRNRYRAVKEIKRYARRVQKSVFEAPRLSASDLARLRGALEGIIDAETDRVRYYTLCGACFPRIVSSGTGKAPEGPRDFEIF